MSNFIKLMDIKTYPKNYRNFFIHEKSYICLNLPFKINNSPDHEHYVCNVTEWKTLFFYFNKKLILFLIVREAIDEKRYYLLKKLVFSPDKKK